MQSIILHTSTTSNTPLDMALEVVRLKDLLAARRSNLVALQAELHQFKARYTQTVGSRLAELAEVEHAIKEAAHRMLGTEPPTQQEDDCATHHDDEQTSSAVPIKTALRKLFWSVARMFHPDHAMDEKEARRRHTIMAEASRAYRDGDVESLHTLLGDEQLQSFCAGVPAHTEDDLAGQLLRLREELRTVEFGLKRIKQDGLYRLKLSADEEARQGRDALAAQAVRIDRQIVKARHRLAHLAG
ncbi:MAG: hypothetical protein H0T92_16010 [Pyrinomonadaceae bacterium]|nr:hypothetical protein [Pyrinomonadaceae bacterium]